MGQECLPALGMRIKVGCESSPTLSQLPIPAPFNRFFAAAGRRKNVRKTKMREPRLKIARPY